MNSINKVKYNLKNNKNNKNNKQEGVTLIALVITIIVLIILAGVSISALTGEKSVIGQAKEAKTRTKFSSIQEAVDLWEVKNESLEVKVTIDQFLDGLVDKNVITREEANTLMDTGTLTENGITFTCNLLIDRPES